MKVTSTTTVHAVRKMLMDRTSIALDDIQLRFRVSVPGRREEVNCG